MPHIHTKSGEIDLCVNVYIVYQNKILLRFHEKHHMWITPGGHVETNEVPEDAAVREAKEEVGLDIKIWTGNRADNTREYTEHSYRELIPPLYMNVHAISDEHRHLSLAYFATADSDVIVEPDNHEKSGGCRWLTKEELLADPEVDQATKVYALKTLEILAD